MSWKIRHQGSPKSVDGLTLEQVVDGVKDGLYERTAEVMGPGETKWTTFESHPLFEEMAYEMDLVEKGPGEAEDLEEQRIDMNPLIDVCLVLLVFFILATTMQVMEKVLDIPRNKVKNEQQVVKKISQEQIDKMVSVKLSLKEGRTAYEVNKVQVPEEELNRFVANLKKQKNASEMVIEATGVDWGSVVKAIDAAGHAEIKKVNFLASSNMVSKD